VYDGIGNQFFETIGDLFKHLPGLLFVKSLSGHNFSEISILAEFSDDVETPLS
jgi:hypothetical protein